MGYLKESLGYYFYNHTKRNVPKQASGKKIDIEEVQETQNATGQIEVPVQIEKHIVPQTN